MGNFQSYTEFGGIRQGWYRFWQVEPYVQDDWKVNRRLTVNIGLRWSYMQPQYSALNNTVQFLPQYFDPKQVPTINPSNGLVISSPNPYNGLVLTGDGFPDIAKGRVAQYSDPAVNALFHGLPKGGANSVWGAFAPRFGFAYDLTGEQTTVLRGGFGVAYERIEGNFIFSGINNTPFNPSANVLNGSTENPGAAAAGPVSVQTIANSHYLDMKLPNPHLEPRCAAQTRPRHDPQGLLRWVERRQPVVHRRHQPTPARFRKKPLRAGVDHRTRQYQRAASLPRLPEHSGI